ncbi:hypothetical protein INT47_005152 [Mucor saturninus]|uniref:Uncharacterized protein n=1 Tax=Mucor saturninus TaxID=64648 RepID=A0A8H7UYN0_9FUNG|nr:hypothetical protein INT47_005152 [Mucor saturninus]
MSYIRRTSNGSTQSRKSGCKLWRQLKQVFRRFKLQRSKNAVHAEFRRQESQRAAHARRVDIMRACMEEYCAKYQNQGSTRHPDDVLERVNLHVRNSRPDSEDTVYSTDEDVTPELNQNPVKARGIEPFIIKTRRNPSDSQSAQSPPNRIDTPDSLANLERDTDLPNQRKNSKTLVEDPTTKEVTDMIDELILVVEGSEKQLVEDSVTDFVAVHKASHIRSSFKRIGGTMSEP